MLQALPASTRLLFVSGEKDEFLDRTKGGTAWRDVGAARGVAALRAAAADLPCAAHATVVGIENTGQQPLRAALPPRDHTVEGRRWALCAATAAETRTSGMA